MLPIFMYMRIKKNGKKKINIFIPLILIWIPMFALLIVLAPFVLILSLIFKKKGYGEIILLTYPVLLSLISALSGLVFQIRNRDKQISIVIK